MRDMGVIHELLLGHERIERRVDDIPGGIRAVTTTEDSELRSPDPNPHGPRPDSSVMSTTARRTATEVCFGGISRLTFDHASA
jgi:hypothetical protein